jgi:hypothetical protein
VCALARKQERTISEDDEPLRGLVQFRLASAGCRGGLVYSIIGGHNEAHTGSQQGDRVV